MPEPSTKRERTESGEGVVDTADVQWQLPNPDTIAAGALEGGLTHAAEKLDVEQHEVLERLQQGDLAACQRYRYGLAKQVAEAIGALDESIRAVYIMDYDATPRDVCFCEEDADPCIHLIVWTQRRTHALSALAAAIDRALVAQVRVLLRAPDLRRLLDVLVVDDSDVSRRSGYGAMLSSVHYQPLPLWEREERA